MNSDGYTLKGTASDTNGLDKVEIEQTDPRAGRNAFKDVVILESQGHAVQRQIFEYDELGQHRQNHYQMQLMLPDTG